MKRLIVLVALVMAMAVLAPAAFADDTDVDAGEFEMDRSTLSDAQMWKARMIADYFAGFPPEKVADSEPAAEEADEELDATLLPDVLALRSTTGWGAVFKLMMYAAAIGEDPSDIGPFVDDGGYGFGSLFKDLEFDGEFTNLGQLQKSYRVKPDKTAKPEKAKPPGQAKKSG
jgi:hypothetical protein